MSACTRLQRCASVGSDRAHNLASEMEEKNNGAVGSARVLWSSPGSGTSWLRILLELATGRSTGSVYKGDRSERHFCPGIDPCRSSMVVKTHFAHDAECDRQLLGRSRILLVRNPYNAMWSEYQRVAAATKQRHRGRAAVNGSNSHTAYITSLGIVHLHYLLFQAKKWQDITSRQRHFAANAASGMVHWVFYEDLRDPRRRISTLQRVAMFAGVAVSEERAACAFNYSDVRGVHRQAEFTASQALAAAEQERARAAAHGTVRAGNEDNVYEVLWKILHAEARFFGYGPLNVSGIGT